MWFFTTDFLNNLCPSPRCILLEQNISYIIYRVWSSIQEFSLKISSNHGVVMLKNPLQTYLWVIFSEWTPSMIWQKFDLQSLLFMMVTFIILSFVLLNTISGFFWQKLTFCILYLSSAIGAWAGLALGEAFVEVAADPWFHPGPLPNYRG